MLLFLVLCLKVLFVDFKRKRVRLIHVERLCVLFVCKAKDNINKEVELIVKQYCTL